MPWFLQLISLSYVFFYLKSISSSMKYIHTYIHTKKSKDNSANHHIDFLLHNMGGLKRLNISPGNISCASVTVSHTVTQRRLKMDVSSICCRLELFPNGRCSQVAGYTLLQVHGCPTLVNNMRRCQKTKTETKKNRQ